MSDSNASSPYTKRTYGGVSGEERSRQRREKLIEAGLQVFGTLGFDKATMRDICASARLAERYFYENFANIDEAFEAVHLELTAKLLTNMTQAVAKAPAEQPLKKAAAGLTAYYSFIQEDPRRAQIILLDAAKLGHNNVHHTGSTMHGFATFMADIVADHRQGLPAGMSNALVTTGLIGMAIQTGVTWFYGGFKEPVSTIVEHNLYAWRGLVQWIEHADKSAQRDTAKS